MTHVYVVITFRRFSVHQPIKAFGRIYFSTEEAALEWIQYNGLMVLPDIKPIARNNQVRLQKINLVA